MRNPDPESIAKSVAAAIADRLTHRDRIADEIAVAISDAYARGYSDALTVLNTQRLTDPVSIAAESGSVISVTSVVSSKWVESLPTIPFPALTDLLYTVQAGASYERFALAIPLAVAKPDAKPDAKRFTGESVTDPHRND
jgi:hypothetical protein